ncbi:3,4-dihydroxyphenylacetate 2,3-dioxygenase [Pontibacillus litoralis]|uniref:3,4-dihydroxyphenylacetate 2,3-dioxygenase n=1 Tax=Pontibacillus litoralis JSM 072002 TaxID=1385512 RepID=A0A0A5FXN2_9BACI|nr:3,4-dihydroxyphenylacetate 2,3-dioxygenase [Pontibacillus litoralis]KGX84544.1 3,4-dihydroxyphenylacetate 2,3-dioxygenase [Pontibacillus litoralis JSM 072002]
MNFDIIRTGRAVLHVTDIEKSKKFYDALGFIITETDDNQIFLRGLEEHNHHSLLLKQRETPALEVISYRVKSEEDLEQLATKLQKDGNEIKWLQEGEQKGLGRAFRYQDISGLPVEFYHHMDRVDRKLQQYDLYKGAKVQRIDHFNCMVSDVEKAHNYYINEFGFACSEYTTGEEDKIWASWLHRKPSVHDVAYMNGPGPRLHHIGFWLKDPMSLIDGCDVLASIGYAPNIERGPGRHGLSNAFFLYLRDPDGHRIELYNGDYFTGDPDFEPIRWELDDPLRQTFWGHEAPDCWFEEATEVLNVLTNEKVQTQAAKLKKRKPTFVI